ncbi:MAG: ribonuclease III [Acidobacteria bacterium]|nr:MAG: ribonuclease III [Acidobacteriota bacterium]
MREERGEKLQQLEALIGYRFVDRRLLERALTHRSFASEKTHRAVRHNEALEFLGDAVLGFLVSDWLLERYPELSEGKLSKLKAYLVSARNLEVHAQRLRLGEFLRLNRGEEKTGGRSKRTLLVDAFEALVAAIYLDGGIEAAKRFLREQFAQVMEQLDPDRTEFMDYKTTLQERLQAQGSPPPVYEVIDERGPAHDRVFHVRVKADGQVIAFGQGRTIKAAHQSAARMALEKLDRLVKTTSAAPKRKSRHNTR